MSWSGLCIRCAEAHLLLNNRQLHNHAGPQYEHWRARLAAAIGARLLDDPQQPA